MHDSDDSHTAVLNRGKYCKLIRGTVQYIKTINRNSAECCLAALRRNIQQRHCDVQQQLATLTCRG